MNNESMEHIIQYLPQTQQRSFIIEYDLFYYGIDESTPITKPPNEECRFVNQDTHSKVEVSLCKGFNRRNKTHKQLYGFVNITGTHEIKRLKCDFGYIDDGLLINKPDGMNAAKAKKSLSGEYSKKLCRYYKALSKEQSITHNISNMQVCTPKYHGRVDCFERPRYCSLDYTGSMLLQRDKDDITFYINIGGAQYEINLTESSKRKVWLEGVYCNDNHDIRSK